MFFSYQKEDSIYHFEMFKTSLNIQNGDTLDTAEVFKQP